MKTMVKLAVLLSVLLLVTGVASAGPCSGTLSCYNLTSICDNGTFTNSCSACIDTPFDGTGTLSCTGTATGSGPLYLFGDGGENEFFELTGDNAWIFYESAGSCSPGVWYFDIGGSGTELRGIGECGGHRCKVRGHRVPCA